MFYTVASEFFKVPFANREEAMNARTSVNELRDYVNLEYIKLAKRFNSKNPKVISFER